MKILELPHAPYSPQDRSVRDEIPTRPTGNGKVIVFPGPKSGDRGSMLRAGFQRLLSLREADCSELS